MEVVLALAVLAATGLVIRTLFGEARRHDRLVGVEDEAHGRVEEELARPGATPDRPIVVATAAVIEPRAERDDCPYCSGALHVEDHVTALEGSHRVRRVTLKCGSCGRRTERFFRIETPVEH